MNRDHATLIQGLLHIIRDGDADSRITAHSLELALALFKDRVLRNLIIDLGIFEIVSSKITHARENLGAVLRLIDACTYQSSVPFCKESKDLAAFLQSRVLANSIPLLVLPIVSNISESKELSEYLVSLPHFERFMRHILEYLSDPDINFLALVYSLQILLRLTVENPIGNSFFKEGNLRKIWQLVFGMLEKSGVSTANLVPVLDLLQEALAVERFGTSFKRFVCVILGANVCISETVDGILSQDLIPVAFRHLASVVNQNPSASSENCETQPDGGDGLIYSCEFIREVLRLVDDQTIPPETTRQLALQVGLSVRVLLRTVCDSLMDTSTAGLTRRVTSDAMIDAVAVCDAVISCAGLRLRAENLNAGAGTASGLEALLRYLARFCASESETDARCGTRFEWGVGDGMVVAILHLAIVVSKVIGKELPSDVIDSNRIKHIIVASLKSCTHPHVISCCLNILAQSPSRQFFVSALAEANLEARLTAPLSVKTYSRPSSDSGMDQMSDSLADMELNPPTPLEQLDDAERSLIVLTELVELYYEKEVDQVTERMKKEMELKEAIFNRKIAAYESKTQLLKSEVLQLQEILEEKISIIKALETSQSESVKKTSEINAAIVSHESEKKVFQAEAGNLRSLLAEAKDQIIHLENELKEKIRLLNSKNDSLETALAQHDALNEKFEDLEKVLEATSFDNEKKLAEITKKLVLKEESESRLQLEANTLRAELMAVSDEKDRLADMVVKYQDEEREHDELVKRLAQLASTASTKRGGT
ncbi:hypothetical protein HDU83_009377 [Entophlyctis luteolus]|nr:hypothetical protein HDU83_009377 [Entophlyctis luteolus]